LEQHGGIPATSAERKGFGGGLVSMYVQGVLTRRVAAVIQELYGHEFKPSTNISAITARLEEQLAQCNQPPLEVVCDSGRSL
jgi:transposase-like protein